MLNYPARSSRAQGFLRRSANDIDIYVEDASLKNVWLALIRKCLPRGARISSVMPLGDRATVLAACRSDQESSRARLYIIDGDFDYLLGAGTPKMSNLYKVPATNLEAFVLMTEGLIPYLHAAKPEEDPAALQQKAASHLELEWFPKLRRLFAYYAENQRLNAGAQTCRYHVSRLCLHQSNPWLPDVSLIAQRALEVLTACRQRCGVGRTLVSVHRKRALQLPIQKAVSGKTYIWPLVENLVKSMGAHPGTPEKLMLAVVSHGKCPNENLRRRLRQQLDQ